MTSNYEFLEMLHRELKPRGYLEIGVRHGDSLRLATCPAIGVDPDLLAVRPKGENFVLWNLTSDDFFANAPDILGDMPLDLVYIDGMHLYEYALRDFINVAQYANERTVVVFDDTHPYSQSIATRTQPPGDWTGDVWKTMCLLEGVLDFGHRSAQVDVSPTGAFVVWDIKHEARRELESRINLGGLGEAFRDDSPVPADIIDRSHTIPPDEAIKQILETLT